MNVIFTYPAERRRLRIAGVITKHAEKPIVSIADSMFFFLDELVAIRGNIMAWRGQQAKWKTDSDPTPTLGQKAGEWERVGTPGIFEIEICTEYDQIVDLVTAKIWDGGEGIDDLIRNRLIEIEIEKMAKGKLDP